MCAIMHRPYSVEHKLCSARILPAVLLCPHCSTHFACRVWAVLTVTMRFSCHCQSEAFVPPGPADDLTIAQILPLCQLRPPFSCDVRHIADFIVSFAVVCYGLTPRGALDAFHAGPLGIAEINLYAPKSPRDPHPSPKILRIQEVANGLTVVNSAPRMALRFITERQEQLGATEGQRRDNRGVRARIRSA